jgi:hypothetical protein
LAEHRQVTVVLPQAVVEPRLVPHRLPQVWQD